MGKEDYLREMAKGDYEVGQPFSRDDFNYFKQGCADDGYSVTEEDFDRYFEILDEIRSEDLEGGEEEMYGFEAMSRTGIENLISVLSQSLKTLGSIVVIQRILEEDFGLDFEDKLTFIKNTVDLSDINTVLNEIVNAAETLLDDTQVEILCETLQYSNDLLEPEEQPEELDEYEEPEDWSMVDEPVQEESEFLEEESGEITEEDEEL